MSHDFFYRYSLIRVRFPNDIFIQSIFKSTETLADLLSYIRELLHHEFLPIWLTTATGQKLTEESRTLAELHLVPAVVLNVVYDKAMLNDIMASAGSSHQQQSSRLLRDEVMAQLEELRV